MQITPSGAVARDDGGQRYETNLPTQEETEKQSARLSQKNEHEDGQKRFETPSQQRQIAAFRLSHAEAA